MIFNIECIVFAIIVLYSLFYQLYVVFLGNQNKKVNIKDGSGLYVSKDVLNNNGLGTLYVTKIKGNYNDHYDIERNVIRLSENIYDEENLSSMAISLYQVIKAISIDKNKRKEEKTLTLAMDWMNKIGFVLFIIGTSMQGLDIMTASIILMFIPICFKYRTIVKRNEFVKNNITYLKKTYKLNKDNVERLEKFICVLLYNELSLHIINNRY